MPQPKKAKAPKRAAKAAPAKDAAPKKPKKSLAPGWAVQKPGLVYRKDPDLEPSSKVAIFDLDGTLLFTKTSSIVPKNEEDWRPFNKKVKGVLKARRRDSNEIIAGVVSSESGHLVIKGRSASTV